jgi:DNA/RNA endonuclease G (NUC1)
MQWSKSKLLYDHQDLGLYISCSLTNIKGDETQRSSPARTALLPSGQPPGLIGVPTHFYKVILADGRGGKGGSREVGVGAFVMPNAPIDPKLPLTAFTVPLEPLEQLAGQSCQYL